MKADIYQRITDQIVRELESGVRPWIKPWNAGNGSGRITRPLRASINVLVLWSEAITKGYQSPVWMTFKQAEDLLRRTGTWSRRSPPRFWSAANSAVQSCSSSWSLDHDHLRGLGPDEIDIIRFTDRG